ncbi:hypothetical protein ACJJTC_002286 [Scirpophaga incertulas]
MSNEELLARTDKLAQYNAVLQQRLLEHFESNSVARVAVKSREPTTEVTTATTTTVTPTSNTGLAAAVAPLFNSQILAPTVTGAQPNIETEPNCHEDIPLATSTTTTSSVKPGCSNWFDDTEINKTPSVQCSYIKNLLIRILI